MMTSQRRAGPTTPTESDPLLLGDRRRVTSLARLRVPFDGRHGPELRYAILREGHNVSGMLPKVFSGKVADDCDGALVGHCQHSGS